MAGELLEFPHGVYGMVLNLEQDNVGSVLFGEDTLIRKGTSLKEPSVSPRCPWGKNLLGGGELLGPAHRRRARYRSQTFPQYRAKSAGIVARMPVKEPLQTGLKAIDSMIPIGRGQRELIIGDRGTGKRPGRRYDSQPEGQEVIVFT